jgi:23S rRNA (cytidine1920-2'-O)/16S rRNA (cytidine1409-2'-O)-methyltransferase
VAKIIKIRLDQLLVERGLIENASKARARIMAGDVIVNEHRADKPGEKFAFDSLMRLRGNSIPFVSRGGFKLAHALKIWPTKIDGSVCMDVGASTGGFTEVLLNHNARLVYAIDVGYGQLAQVLRVDPRVINMERTHILQLQRSDFRALPTISVIDVSFISLTKVLPHVVKLMSNNTTIFALIKPQFEAGRENVEKGGIVKDSKVHQQVLDKIASFSEKLGLEVIGVEKSPILGAKGNQEFLLCLLHYDPDPACENS